MTGVGRMLHVHLHLHLTKLVGCFMSWWQFRLGARGLAFRLL